MKILSNKKYNELILKSCKGMFGAVTDDMLLRENALLNDENKQLKEENARLKEWKEDLLNENIELENIRKETIEYIKKQEDYFNNYPLIDRNYLLEILGDKENE